MACRDTIIDSLPRGEKDKARNALRQYVYGLGNMPPDDAIERYKERCKRDAQAPVGATDFDDLESSATTIRASSGATAPALSSSSFNCLRAALAPDAFVIARAAAGSPPPQWPHALFGA